jgi:hypothetical protein
LRPRSFVLNYRGEGGRERRYTIGRFGDWTVDTAREEARQLKAAIGRGVDPLAERRVGGKLALYGFRFPREAREYVLS